MATRRNESRRPLFPNSALFSKIDEGDVEALLSSLKENVERIFRGALGPSYAQQQPASSISIGRRAPPVHYGITCDSCNKTVIGTRHKCSDCPDYDLCTICMGSGASERHNPFHEFFDIETPRRFDFRSILGGSRSTGSREHHPSPNPDRTPVAQQQGPVATPANVSAICNLCESAIVGGRCECFISPDTAFPAHYETLGRPHAEQSQHTRTTFQCSICMDDLPQDFVTSMDGCVHTTCQTCLREFVSSKIQEHRYPIFCPVCTIAPDGTSQPSVISRFLIEQLGISEEEFQILTDMELAGLSVQIHCRACRRAAYVDREDYMEAVNIECPQRDCHHVWCKKCEQTIIPGGSDHSCDGTSELDHLMKEKGWKRCPTCATPIVKELGCNHITCITPGCNSHFCYVCGGMIVQSALSSEINDAVSTHFRECQLFEIED